MSGRSSARALGVGAFAVLVAGIVAAAVHDTGSVKESAVVRPAAVGSPSPSPVAPSPVTSSPPVVVPAAQQANGPKTPKHQVARHKPPTVLPYTGPMPIPPTLALALLFLASGCWTLVRWPALGYEAARGLSALARSRGRRRTPPRDGAIERLRSPGHQHW